MGIDVWVRAMRHPPQSRDRRDTDDRACCRGEARAKRRSDRARAGAQQTDARRPARLRTNSDHARLHRVAHGVVVVGECASPLDRAARARHCARSGRRSAQLQKSQFRWPQTQTGDSSDAAARNAYPRISARPDRTRDRALAVVARRDCDRIGRSRRATRTRDVAHYRICRALRADPNEKKRLWLSVSPRIPA